MPTKRTTQAFAIPMTGVEAFEAGRREYEAVAAGSTGANPGGASGRPPGAPQSRCERNMTKARPHLFTPKRGDRNNKLD
jgi:hypothetical protein